MRNVSLTQNIFVFRYAHIIKQRKGEHMDIIVPGNNIEPRIPACTCYCETDYPGCPSVCMLLECIMYVCGEDRGW